VGDWEVASFSEEEQRKFANYPQIAERALDAYALEREAVRVLENVAAAP